MKDLTAAYFERRRFSMLVLLTLQCATQYTILRRFCGFISIECTPRVLFASLNRYFISLSIETSAIERSSQCRFQVFPVTWRIKNRRRKFDVCMSRFLPAQSAIIKRESAGNRVRLRCLAANRTVEWASRRLKPAFSLHSGIRAGANVPQRFNVASSSERSAECKFAKPRDPIARVTSFAEANNLCPLCLALITSIYADVKANRYSSSPAVSCRERARAAQKYTHVRKEWETRGGHGRAEN